MTFEIANDEVQLLEWKTVGGTLKSPRVPNASAGIFYSAVSSAGTSLWEGAIADPRVLRLEYPDESGELTNRVLVHDTSTFTIRVPARADIGRLDFSAAQWSKDPTLRKQSAIVSLGGIDWPQSREGRLR